MRKGAEPLARVRNTDFLQKLDDARLDLFGSYCVMQLQNLADLPGNRVQGIERGHRLLEDHGDVGAPNLAQPRLAAGDKVLALEIHLALNLRGARKQAHDG